FFRYNPLWGKEKFSPYLFTGISLMNFQPKARDDSGNWVRLRDLGTEGQGLPGNAEKYKLAGLAIPFGLGFKYNLGLNWNLTAEMGYRASFTDYLADVSGYYPNPDNLEVPEAVYF